ncbi:UDP-GlcNAc--UDP-phosphate GlcNAc-1-phosphate transferase [Jiulongibacter sediminis]|nr:UDP-GlcNAc--UDP-phosphate GlcNAc-1-phosphate transferase [Jiulongibacter sediminis]
MAALFLAFSGLGYLYIVFARKLHIHDVPNNRSSHKQVTVRGIGVLFPLAVLYYACATQFQYPFFLMAIFTLASISFLDDLFTLSGKARFLVQLIGTGLMLYQIDLESNLLLLFTLFFLGVGFLNAFNFMDGINGITGLYGLVGAVSLSYMNQKVRFIDQQLLTLLMLALVTFLWFNFRKRALAFGGDVGSISLAAILFFGIVLLGEAVSWKYLMFFSLYGLDTGYTLFYRLLKGEAIFEAHRLHFFQLMANELRISHLRVSVLYAGLQLFLNTVLVLSDQLWIVLVVHLVLLVVMHRLRARLGKGVRWIPKNK